MPLFDAPATRYQNIHRNKTAIYRKNINTDSSTLEGVLILVAAHQDN